MRGIQIAVAMFVSCYSMSPRMANYASEVLVPISRLIPRLALAHDVDV